jgi:hypothetical protein
VEATSKEDDHAEQAYMDVDLAKDVRVKVFDVEDKATGSLVWLAVARSEGFGQAAMRLVAMQFDLGTLAGILHEQGIHGLECPLFFPLVLNQWTPRGVSAAWQGFCSDCMKVPEAWVTYCGVQGLACACGSGCSAGAGGRAHRTCGTAEASCLFSVIEVSCRRVCLGQGAGEGGRVCAAVCPC